MTILIDAPRWEWRDERWAHLASDDSAAELHAFAADVGLRRLAFQGDHYDLPQPLFDAAIAAGATLVDSRELVRRLRESGLRHRAKMGWQSVVNAGDLLPGEAVALLRDCDERFGRRWARSLPPTLANSTHVIVLERPTEFGVGLAGADVGRAATHQLENATPWYQPVGPQPAIDWIVPRDP